MRLSIAAVAAVALVLPLAAAQATPTFPLTRVAQDRIVDGAGLHHSAQQAFLASAAGSKTLVGTYQLGRIFNGGASAIGAAYSVNGGKSWKDVLVPGTVATGGTLWRASDPTIAWDRRDGEWLNGGPRGTGRG